MDFVFVKDLAVRTISGVDAWKRPQTQPLSVSVFINSNFRRASQTDHLRSSLNYDVISRTLAAEIEASQFRNLTHVAESVANSVLKMCNVSDWARIEVKKPRHLLRAESAELVLTRQRKTETVVAAPPGTMTDLVKINQLSLVTIIGVNTIERLHKQTVLIDLVLYKPLGASEDVEQLFDASKISETVAAHVENASYKTLEAFTESVAHVVISLGIDKVKVSAAKPSALTWAKCAGIEVTRTRDDFDELLDAAALVGTAASEEIFPQTEVDSTKTSHAVYLAFGTNIGDRLANIQQVSRLLEEHGVKVLRISSIYKSQPMYVQDQQEFYNGVFAAETALSPPELLKIIKVIEYEQFHRQNLQRNGPRPMDIDILLYDDAVINSPELTIPHIDMLNRSFVLQPLVDVASADLLHPLTAEPFSSHLAQIPASSDNQISSALTRVIPCPGDLVLELDPVSHTRPTVIMAILNTTPDSFSDGGRLATENCLEVALENVRNGATILDIGGQSTRPGAAETTVQEEIDRVVPIIQKLRSQAQLNNVLISVDTYRSEVAQAALAAGANIINDVFSGQLDPKLFKVAADYKAPIILSHSRGDPKTMDKLATYDQNDIVQQVGQELAGFVAQALAAGVERWQILLDPGFGFAKNINQNIQLIRDFDKLRQYPALKGFPWLVGTSRKRFIGTLANIAEAADRDIGTCATTTMLINKGADIIRVHNSKAAAETVAIADAIYRN